MVSLSQGKRGAAVVRELRCYHGAVPGLLVLVAIVGALVGALYLLGRPIDPDDRNDPGINPNI